MRRSRMMARDIRRPVLDFTQRDGVWADGWLGKRLPRRLRYTIAAMVLVEVLVIAAALLSISV